MPFLKPLVLPFHFPQSLHCIFICISTEQLSVAEHRSVKGDLIVLKTVLVYLNFLFKTKKKKKKNLPI